MDSTPTPCQAGLPESSSFGLGPQRKEADSWTSHVNVTYEGMFVGQVFGAMVTLLLGILASHSRVPASKHSYSTSRAASW